MGNGILEMGKLNTGMGNGILEREMEYWNTGMGNGILEYWNGKWNTVILEW